MPIAITLKLEEVQPGIITLQYQTDFQGEVTDREQEIKDYLVERVNEILSDVGEHLEDSREIIGPSSVVDPVIDETMNRLRNDGIRRPEENPEDDEERDNPGKE